MAEQKETLAPQSYSLYVKDLKSVDEIATILKTSKQNIYRWKKQASDKGEKYAWDRCREVWHMSPRELFGIYAEAIKEMMLELSQNPKLLVDSKMADAITKHVANLEKIDPTSRYLGVFMDLIKEIDTYLSKHDKDLQAKMLKHWEGIKQHIVALLQERKG